MKRLIARLPESCQGRLRKIHYRRKLAAASIHDEPELGAVPKFAGPGQTVLDVGANFGLFSRFLSEAVGPEGRVFSFEPIPEMHEVLAHNISALPLTNTECFNVAVSDEPGTAEIRIPKWPNGTLNYYEASLSSSAVGDEKVVTVQKITLDDFCESRDLGEVTFIKCDVEGHEISVLEGAGKLIATHHPVILLEVNDSLVETEKGRRVRSLVESLGYTINVFQDGSVFPWEPGDNRVNYVLLPDEAAAGEPTTVGLSA
ncbi:MAG: FkbM family methyltransferase [Verrucomicrobiales bacterium]